MREAGASSGGVVHAVTQALGLSLAAGTPTLGTPLVA